MIAGRRLIVEMCAERMIPILGERNPPRDKSLPLPKREGEEVQTQARPRPWFLPLPRSAVPATEALRAGAGRVARDEPGGVPHPASACPSFQSDPHSPPDWIASNTRKVSSVDRPTFKLCVTLYWTTP